MRKVLSLPDATQAKRRAQVCGVYTVEPPIKDTPNKEHLSIKDKSTRPNPYTFKLQIRETSL